MYQLSRRLRRLRQRVLTPLALLSASAAVPSYLFLREQQFQAQWSGGALTAYHLPLLTGLLSMLPAVALFGVSTILYRSIRDRRLEVWKRELSHEFELPPGHLDDVGRIFH